MSALGQCKVKKCQKSELTMEVVGWAQVSLRKKLIVKLSQNIPIQCTSINILGFWGTMCIFCIYSHASL